MRKANGDSDHSLVKGILKVKIKKVTHKKKIVLDKCDTDRLNKVDSCEGL